MYYKIGYPFWKVAAKMGVAMKIRVDVLRDEEANVYVASSEDLPGLVCEATTMDLLVEEVNSSVNELLSFQLPASLRQPVTDLRLNQRAICSA